MNDLIHNRSSLIKDLLIINSIMSSLTNFQKALQKLKKTLCSALSFHLLYLQFQSVKVD